MLNTRAVAAKIIFKIEKDNSYSNITLDSYFKENEISQQDKAFVTTLVYGVLERKITLDFVLKKFIKTPLKKVSPFTLAVLQTALYQIIYMDKVPHSAAVNEAVKSIKKSKDSRNTSFVNAVLRNVLRENIQLPTGDTAEDLSVTFSCSLPIVENLIKDYGTENTKLFLEQSLQPAPFTIRLNTLKTDEASFKSDIDIEVEPTALDYAFVLKQGISVSENPLYKKGHFFVQDIASQRAVAVLAPKAGEMLLDMCAAPGGKSFSAAILMQNTGKIISCDLYEHKCKLIKDSAKRLGLDIIEPRLMDATVHNESLGLFDCVLCDVPCSGIGIIRRKPEIKYKDFSEFKNLPQIQTKILNNAQKYLKDGGRILYSTCTLRKAENEEVVERFLKENPEFSLEFSHTFMPHTDSTDGFFCALLRK